MSEEWDADEDKIRKKSKQQQKREAEAAQALGKEIVELPIAQFRQVLEKLDLPEKLQDAMVQCRDMKAREARRRQMQFIGKLMRDLDLEPVQAVMNRFKQGGQAERAMLHQLEAWRERLLTEGDSALEELVSLYPQADTKQLHQYVTTAKHEAAHKQTPRAARLLFRYLRDLMQE